VGCCRGTMISCTRDNPTEKGASDIVKGCIEAHEKVHWPDTVSCDWSGCGPEYACRPYFWPKVVAEDSECRAYKAELECLNKKIGNCDAKDLTKEERKACKRVVNE